MKHSRYLLIILACACTIGILPSNVNAISENDTAHNITDRLVSKVVDTARLLSAVAVENMRAGTYSITSAPSGRWSESDDGKKLYRHSDGSYKKSSWDYIDDSWFYFDQNSRIMTGWLGLNGKWYYLGAHGSMITGWYKINNKWYYFCDNGEMATGWLDMDGDWYYFASNGQMITGARRINGIDYYFEQNGILSYDASMVAAVYSKDYGNGNINTLKDGISAANILGLGYLVERYDNFDRMSFVSTDNLIGTENLNRGIFFYSGHGNSGGLTLGNGQQISPLQLSNMEMNNTKVAFFFSCYGGQQDSHSKKSLVSAAIEAGAKASYGYRVSSNVSGDRAVADVILEAMMGGASLQDAVNKARAMYPNYSPISTTNLVLGGNVNIKIDDFQIKNDSTGQIAPDGLRIPDGYVFRDSVGGFDIYQLRYNGYWATDKIVCDKERTTFYVNRNVIDPDTLQTIDFSAVEVNKKQLTNLYDMSIYTDYVDFITVVNGETTVIRVCSKVVNGVLEYDCFDLQTKHIVNDSVDLFEDIF